MTIILNATFQLKALCMWNNVTKFQYDWTEDVEVTSVLK